MKNNKVVHLIRNAIDRDEKAYWTGYHFGQTGTPPLYRKVVDEYTQNWIAGYEDGKGDEELSES